VDNFPKRGDVYWVNLDPTIGSEINKKRPCLIISNDEGNEVSSRVAVAAITSTCKALYPFHVKIHMNKKEGRILLNQIRTIDKSRLERKITSLEKETMIQVNKALKIYLALT
jgi:mRNA interferase MazF